MSLKERIDAIKIKFEGATPKDKLEVMHRATEELARSGLVDKALKAGERAPDFSLTDANGAPVGLGSLLESGPVVLSFFRGVW